MSNLQRGVRAGIVLTLILVFLVFLVTAYATTANTEPITPTVAKVTDFNVVLGKGGALLEWRTGFEVDNLGFNLYRERGGQRTLINPSVIAGSALTAGIGTPLTAGRSYVWRDAQGTADAFYYLESIDLNGATKLTGPVKPVAGSVPTKQQQAMLLADVGSNASGQSAQTEGPATLMSGSVSITPDGALQDQWAIAALPAVKINVRKNDWYHVTQADLVAAGLNSSANAANLQLFVDGVEQPMLVKSVNGTFSAGDFIEFYGTGLNLTETDTHVYWLVAGSTQGKRVKLVGNEQPDAVNGSETPAQIIPTQPVALPRLSKDASEGSFLWTFMQILGRPTVENAQPAQVTQPASEENREAAIQQDQKNAVEAEETADGTVNSTVDTKSQPDATATSPSQVEVPLSIETTKKNVASVRADTPAKTAPTVRQDEQPQTQTRKMRASRKTKARHARKRLTARRELSHYSVAAASTGSSTGEAQSFAYTVEIKDRTVYFSSLLNGDAENFFGKVIASVPVTQTLNISNLDTTAPDSVVLELAVQGVSAQPHEIIVSFNDTQVGTINYFFRDHAVVTLPLDLSLLHEGSNSIKFTTTAGGDVNIIDYIRLTYPHKYQADNNALRFSLKNSQTARVEGFTSPNIRLVDITDPLDTQQLRPTIEPSGAGYALVIGTQGRNSKGRRTLMAFPNGQLTPPAKLVANQPSDLNRTSQSADFVIVSYRTLKQSLAPLADLRRNEGLAVNVVDVDDIYDEFSYGTHTPRAIKDFLAYTKAHWTKAPRFVLLAGDSSYDPKDYFQKGDFDLVPSKLVDTLFTETASDDWLVDFDNDAVPDMALGRLPARTSAELDRMVSHIVNYNLNAVSKSALFVADEQGTYPFSFEDENRSIAALLPNDISVTHVDRGSNPNINVTRAQFFNSVNQGPMIVNYAGHGTVDAWTGASFFTDPDALALNNGASNSNHLPLFVMMTCLNGYYNDPLLDSISESLMKAPNGGAVAVWASSGLTVPSGQALANQSLYQSIYSNPTTRLGEAIQKAKAATPDTDVRLTWTLFGDPTMKLR
jgi:hypothetical protein